MTRCTNYKSWREAEHPLNIDECYWWDYYSGDCDHKEEIMREVICLQPWIKEKNHDNP